MSIVFDVDAFRHPWVERNVIPDWQHLFRPVHFFFNDPKERQDALERRRMIGNLDTMPAFAPRIH
jgi:hypothetical protein